jgi:hypothetical protein
MTFRQLEFALLQIIQQVDELLEAIQIMIQAKLPVNLTKLTALHNILRNVSLHLPENYEQIVGTRTENFHLYYDLIIVSVVGKVRCVKFIMNIPLKTANRHFNLYKIIVLQTRISEDNFVKYFVECSFFGLSDNQHDYFLFKEADLNRCNMNSIVICPGDVAIYNR